MKLQDYSGDEFAIPVFGMDLQCLYIGTYVARTCWDSNCKTRFNHDVHTGKRYLHRESVKHKYRFVSLPAESLSLSSTSLIKSFIPIQTNNTPRKPRTISIMKFNASVLFAIFAVGALALPEPIEEAAGSMPRCVANQANCAGSKYIGDDNCRCSGQKAPCGNWKCGWDGAHSIVCTLV